MVLSDPGGAPVDATHNWSCGFLPPLYQGTVLQPQEPRILNLDPPADAAVISSAEPRFPRRAEPPPSGSAIRRGRPGSPHRQLRTCRRHADRRQGGARSHARAERVRNMYGLDHRETREYGTRCLIARRLVERGVRFVATLPRWQPWDTQTTSARTLPAICKRTDQPVCAARQGLEATRLLDDHTRPLGRRDRSLTSL